MFLKKKIDLHTHTTVSDGSDTPAELLQHVREAGIGLFAICDHDAVKGDLMMRLLLRRGDPAFISGMEFSCKDEQGNYHILGFHCDPESKAIQSLVIKSHSLRMRKVTARLDFLKEHFGFTFPKAELDKLLSQDNPGKPHIGNLMVKYGYAKSKEDAIKNYINQKRFKSEFVRPEEAINQILAGGGIPVLAHPFYGDGDQLIVGEDMQRRLERLIGYGLQGVEAFYSGFTDKLTEEMLAYAEHYALYVTAGSDYHGRNKLVVLGDTGMKENTPVPDGMLRFFEAVDPALIPALIC